MEILQRIFSYSEKDEGKSFSLKVFIGRKIPYIIQISKNGKTTELHAYSILEVAGIVRSYGDKIYNLFKESIDEDIPEVVKKNLDLDEINISDALNERPFGIQHFEHALVGDIVKDVWNKNKFGKVVAVEYIGSTHRPLYHVVWEDGTKTVNTPYQLVVVQRSSNISLSEINKIKDLINNDEE